MKTFDELYAAVRDLPIVDWHNHLDVRMLAEDRPLGSLYEVWVKSDPYKHRAMRICGEPEELITGREIGEAERWAAWMRTLPKLVGNPIFAWAKMELELLGLDVARYLRGEGENVSLAHWTPSRLMRTLHVETLCPCVGAGDIGKLRQDSTPTSTSSPLLHEFPLAMADVSSHLVATCRGGSSHRHDLPHVAHDSSLMFVTFRLADSLPKERLAELTAQKAYEDDRRRLQAISEWLDAGFGSCILARRACRQVVEEALEFFDERGEDKGRYRLHAYVVMPNHVHVLFELKRAFDLASVVKSWKAYSARRINAELGTSGAVWQEEYFDRMIRDTEHYGRVIAYIRRNAEMGSRLVGSADLEVRAPRGVAAAEGVVVRPSLRLNAGDLVTDEQLTAFAEAGCRVVDISVDDDDDLERQYDSLAKVAGFAAARGWTMLLHLGALRETSARLRAVAGPAGGYAGMRAPVDPAKVARFLGRLEGGSADLKARASGVGLPRTILLTLNPEAHAQLAVLAGSFNAAGVPGKVQLGPAWWWCDHEEGIRDVLEKSAGYGVLSTFVGMTTDSRSLLSFVRHDYFRRVLCRWMAEKIAAGTCPEDDELIRPVLENVCYRNAEEMIHG